MSAKPQGGLGRGLGALIQPARRPPPATPAPHALHPTPSAPPPLETAGTPAAPAAGTVPVARIHANRLQPRHRFESEPLEELTASVRMHGVLQPITVRRAGADFELIAGERRWRAAREAGLAVIPARIVECDDTTALEWALVENLQRENLNAIEEAEGYRTLQEKFSLTQEQVAEKVGKPRATVANSLRLLALPADVRELVEQGRLGAGHAKVLLGAAGPLQSPLARQCAMEQWSVRELERRVAKPAGAVPRRARPSRDDLPPDHARDLQDRLQQKLGTAVRVVSSRTLPNGRKRKGRVEIDYFTADDLDRLMLILGISDAF